MDPQHPHQKNNGTADRGPQIMKPVDVECGAPVSELLSSSSPLPSFLSFLRVFPPPQTYPPVENLPVRRRSFPHAEGGSSLLSPDTSRTTLFKVSCVSEKGTMLKQAFAKAWSKGVYAYGGNRAMPCLYVPTSDVHNGQIQCAPRSFFGVEDFLDDDNSRPYTYQKEKKSKNPTKHISFKQRTIAYIEPFTLDVFISKRFVSASITHRVTTKQVATAGTNSKDIKAVLKSRCDIPACLAVGQILADRAREADVYTAAYTPRDRDKFEGKIRAVVQSLIDNGIDVKVYLD